MFFNILEFTKYIHIAILLNSTISTLFFAFNFHIYCHRISRYKNFIYSRLQEASILVQLLCYWYKTYYILQGNVFRTRYLYFLLSRRSHSLLELLEPLDVGGLGLLRLLLEDLMALGHPPVVRLR